MRLVDSAFLCVNAGELLVEGFAAFRHSRVRRPARHIASRALVSIVGCRGLHGHLGSRQSALVSWRIGSVERTTNPFRSQLSKLERLSCDDPEAPPRHRSHHRACFQSPQPWIPRGGSSCGSSGSGGRRVRCPDLGRACGSPPPECHFR